MQWIPIGAWAAAAVIAVVVLGFCAYEIAWKSRRLRHDVAGLAELGDELTRLQAAMTIVRRRAAAVTTTDR